MDANIRSFCKPSEQTGFVTLSTGAVHYREWGAGPALLLLHANPGDSRDFAAIVPALSQHHRVIALDWPGCGYSEVPSQPDEWDAMRYRSVLVEFLAALDLSRVALLGNSLGGNVAARLAIDEPQRVSALVLVSPGGFTPHNVVTRAFCRLQGSSWALSPHRWASWYLRRRTDVTRAMLARAAGEQSRPDRLAVNRAVWRSFIRPEHDLRADAHRIPCPTLMVFGRDDPAIPARKDGREAKRCMPSAETVALPCGHAPFAECPDEFLAVVQPFLSGVAAESEADARAPRSRLR